MNRRPFDPSPLASKTDSHRCFWFFWGAVVCLSLLILSTSHAQSNQAQATEASQALRFVIGGDRSKVPLDITFKNCISRVNEADSVDLGLIPGIEPQPKPDRWDYAYDWNKVIWASATVVTREFRGQCDPVRASDVLSTSSESMRRIECNKLKRKGRWKEVQFNCKSACNWKKGLKQYAKDQIAIEIPAVPSRVSKALADIEAICPGVASKY